VGSIRHNSTLGETRTVFHSAIGFSLALTRRYGLVDVARAVLSYATDSLVSRHGVYEEALAEAVKGAHTCPTLRS